MLYFDKVPAKALIAACVMAGTAMTTAPARANDGGAIAAGAILGIAAGAMIGAAQAQAQPRYYYYRPNYRRVTYERACHSAPRFDRWGEY